MEDTLPEKRKLHRKSSRDLRKFLPEYSAGYSLAQKYKETIEVWVVGEGIIWKDGKEKSPALTKAKNCICCLS